jgi:hypothetical protein
MTLGHFEEFIDILKQGKEHMTNLNFGNIA